MKLALIQPSNLLHAPYLNYYRDILDKEEVEYDIINWNRLAIENEDTTYSYNRNGDLKSNIFKKIFDYYLFSRYVRKLLHKNKYDKIIIFIPQFAIYLSNIFKKEYKDKYILDIRDYGKANMYYKKLDEIIRNSYLTVISSEGYKDWLPEEYSYIISHNTDIKEYKLDSESNKVDIKSKEEITISNIGSIRNYDENIKVINAFSNKKGYKLNYIGKGMCEEELKEYCIKNNIFNVSFYGRYEKEDELSFYKKSDIINIITPKNNYGNNTAMANRLYNAIITGCPVIVRRGTYMSKIVEKYNLGILIDLDRDDIVKMVNNYMQGFDYYTFIKGCNDFFEKVEQDQKIFEEKVKEFINL